MNMGTQCNVHFLALLMLGLMGWAAPAIAGSATWTGLGEDANWSNTTNWTGATIPNGAGQTATFGGSGNGNTAITLGGGAITLGSFGNNGILFDTAMVVGYAISNGTINTFQGSHIVRLNPAVANNQVVAAALVSDSQGIMNTSQNVVNNSPSAQLTLGDLSTTPAINNGSVAYRFQGLGDFVVTGAITDDSSGGGSRLVSVNNNRHGTLTLSGANNFTGLVENANGNQQNVQVSLGGSLVFDYSAGNTVVPDGMSIASGRQTGGNLVFKGRTSGTTSITLSSTQRFAQGSSIITVDQNGGDGTTLVLGSDWRGWNTTGGGKMSLFDLSSGGQVQVSGAIAGGYNIGRGVIRSSDGRSAVTVKGIDGKTYFATNDAGYIVAQTNLITMPTSGGGSFDNNYQVTTDTTLTGSGAFAGFTLRIEGASANQTLDLGGRSWNGGGTILMDGANDFAINNFTNITPGNGVMVMGPGKLTLGGTKTSGDLEKFGPGLLEVTGNFIGSSGATYVWGGTYRAVSASALTTGLLTMSDSVLELGYDFTRALGSSAGNIRSRDNGYGTTEGASFGFSAYGGDRTVNLGGSSAVVTFGGSGGFVMSRDAKFLLSSPTSDSTVDFQNPLNLNNDQQTIDVRNGSASVDANLSGIITNGGLIKTGSGTLALTANNIYGLGTVVGEGVLLANNGIGSVGTGTTVVVSGATLGGTGVVGGTVASLGTVAPGASVGRLSVLGSYEQNASATLDVEIEGATTHDVLAVTGSATLGGELAVTVGFSPVAGNSFTVLTASAVSGTFDTTNLPPLGGSLSWTVSYGATEVVLGVEESGGSPIFGVSPAMYDFGGVEVDSSSSVTFVVTNSGAALMTGTATVSGSPYVIESGASYSVAVGGSSNIVISFTPSLAETYLDSVVFLSDGGSATNALAGYGFIIAGSTNTSISQMGGLVTLNFSLMSGALYRVEATTNLLNGASWTNITAQLTNRTGSLLNFSDTNALANPMRAYRILSP